ncbi:hypothetical protein [Halomonas daqiaonensis]|uniref:hypothetical protein n=1 Tax=Halomonas daqiaonensis TaxID=650850 RepID=UPI001113A394|nr:hypothetical protein [Halomonas daqiaonensis]
MSERQPNHNLQSLMLGLYYPAVLGTGLVVFVLRITTHDNVSSALSDIALYYALLFGVFFSACFLSIQKTEVGKYGVGVFFLDLAEVLGMFLVYYFLGLFDPNKIVSPNFSMIYWVLISVIALQQVWALSADRETKSLWALRLVGVSFLVLGAMWLFKYSWANVIILVVLYALVFRYLKQSFAY